VLLRNGGYSFRPQRVEVGRVLRPFSTFLDADLHLSVSFSGPGCKFIEKGE